MSKRRRAFALALAVLAVPAKAQDRPANEPVQTPSDVTGAGTLDLGDLDPVLRDHRRALAGVDGRLPLVLRIDRSGAVVGCKASDASLPEISEAICAHALGEGRFTPLAFLALDYREATYHVTVSAREKGKGPYWLATDYPDAGVAVRFGDYPIPPVANRLSAVDVRSIPMHYPSRALKRGLEARVVLALTFGEDGRVATCRPISSSNSSRMAYDTCRAAYRSYRLPGPSDARPYVFATNWILSD